MKIWNTPKEAIQKIISIKTETITHYLKFLPSSFSNNFYLIFLVRIMLTEFFIFLLLIVSESFSDTSEIRELIEKIKKSPPEERYIHMNELKLRLRELNEEQREEVIRRLYRELSGREYEREGREHEEKRKHMYEREEEHEREMEHEEGMMYEERMEMKWEEREERREFEEHETEREMEENREYRDREDYKGRDGYGEGEKMGERED